jgi:hypothetical protein
MFTCLKEAMVEPEEKKQDEKSRIININEWDKD